MPAGVTTDLAGNPVSGATYTWRYRPASPSYTTVSNVANGVSGGALAVALAAPAVMSTAGTGVRSSASAVLFLPLSDFSHPYVMQLLPAI